MSAPDKTRLAGGGAGQQDAVPWGSGAAPTFLSVPPLGMALPVPLIGSTPFGLEYLPPSAKNTYLSGMALTIAPLGMAYPIHGHAMS